MTDKYEKRRIYGAFYCCKRLKMLEYLLKQGFTVAHTAPDATNDKYRVWYFVNSKSLENAVNAFYEEYFSKNNG